MGIVEGEFGEELIMVRNLTKLVAICSKMKKIIACKCKIERD